MEVRLTDFLQDKILLLFFVPTLMKDVRKKKLDLDRVRLTGHPYFLLSVFLDLGTKVKFPVWSTEHIFH